MCEIFQDFFKLLFAGLMDKKSRLKQLRKLSLKNTEVSDVSLRYITQYLPQVKYTNIFPQVKYIFVTQYLPQQVIWNSLSTLNHVTDFNEKSPALTPGHLGMLETHRRRDGDAGEEFFSHNTWCLPFSLSPFYHAVTYWATFNGFHVYFFTQPILPCRNILRNI